MKEYTFERIKEQDLDEVMDIYLYYIKHSTATFHINPISRDEMRTLVIFEDCKYETYGIRQDDTLCGYVLLTQYKAREAYDKTAEVTIYLKHGYERCGLGSMALSFIEEIAKTKAFHSLVSLVCGENMASIRLFEKHAYIKCAHFKEVGYKFDRWLDLVCYQKILD